MSIREQIDTSIQPILIEALSQGFRAFIVTPDEKLPRRARFAYLCLDMDNSFALVEAPATRLELPTLSAPIHPNRDYGSSVLVDYDGSVEDAVAQLRATCVSETVTVRFMKDSHPVVANRGKKSMALWRDNITELTAGMFTQ